MTGCINCETIMIMQSAVKINHNLGRRFPGVAGSPFRRFAFTFGE